MNEALPVVSEKRELDGLARVDAPAIWDGFRTAMETLRKRANGLQVTEVTQTDRMKEARELRLALRDIRIAVEARRMQLGAFHLRQTQNINAAARDLKLAIEPLETRLLEQEQFVERERERVERDNREARTLELAPYLIGPVVVDLGKLSDKEYFDLTTVYKGAAEARAEQARKFAAEEAERQAAEVARATAAALEVARLRQEAQAVEAERVRERAEHAEQAAAAAVVARAREAALVAAASEREAEISREREAARVAAAKAPAKAPPAWFGPACIAAEAADAARVYSAAALAAAKAGSGLVLRVDGDFASPADREAAFVAAAAELARVADLPATKLLKLRVRLSELRQEFLSIELPGCVASYRMLVADSLADNVGRLEQMIEEIELQAEQARKDAVEEAERQEAAEVARAEHARERAEHAEQLRDVRLALNKANVECERSRRR